MSNPKFDNISKKEKDNNIPEATINYKGESAPRKGYFDIGFGYLSFFNKRANRNNALESVNNFNSLIPISREQADSWSLIREKAKNILNIKDDNLKKEQVEILNGMYQDHYDKFVTGEYVYDISANATGTREVFANSNFDFLNQSENKLAFEASQTAAKYDLGDPAKFTEEGLLIPERNYVQKDAKPAHEIRRRNKAIKGFSLYLDKVIGMPDYEEAAAKRMIVAGNVDGVLSLEDIAFLPQDPSGLLLFNSLRFEESLDPEQTKGYFRGKYVDTFLIPAFEFGTEAKMGATAFKSISVLGKTKSGFRFNRLANLDKSFRSTEIGKKFADNPVFKNLTYQLSGSVPVRGTAAALPNEYTWEEAGRDIAIESAFNIAITKIITRTAKGGSGSQVVKKVNNAFGKGNIKSIEKLTLKDIQVFRTARAVALDQLTGRKGKVTDPVVIKQLQEFIQATDEVAQIIGASEQSARKLAKLLKGTDIDAIIQYSKKNEWFLDFVQSKVSEAGDVKIDFRKMTPKEIKKASAVWNTKVNSYSEYTQGYRADIIDILVKGNKSVEKLPEIKVSEAASEIVVKENLVKRNNTGGAAGINYDNWNALLKKIKKQGDTPLKIYRINALRASIAQEMERTIDVLESLIVNNKLDPAELEDFIFTNPDKLEEFNKAFSAYLEIQAYSGQRLRSLAIPVEEISPTLKGGVGERIKKEVQQSDQFVKEVSSVLERIIRIKKLNVNEAGELVGLPSENLKLIRNSIDEISSLKGKVMGSGSSTMSDNQLVRLLEIAPWVTLRSTFLGKTFNRLVEPLYGASVGIIDRNYEFWAAFLRKDYQAQRKALDYTENFNGFLAGITRLMNPGSREASRKILQNNGIMANFTHGWQSLSVHKTQKYYQDGMTNPLSFDYLLTNKSQSLLINSKANQKMKEWSRKLGNKVQEKLNKRLNRPAGSNKPVSRAEHLDATLTVILEDYVALLNSGEPIVKIWNDVTELMQFSERLIPLVGDAITEASHIPQYARQSVQRLYSNMQDLYKNQGGFGLPDDEVAELLARTQKIVADGLANKNTADSVEKYLTYLNDTFSNDAIKRDFIDELASAMTYSEDGISRLTLKTDLGADGRIGSAPGLTGKIFGYPMRLIDDYEKMVRKSPVANALVNNAFVRTGTNISAATIDLMMPINDIIRYQSYGTYDRSKTMAKIGTAITLGYTMHNLWDNGAIDYDEDRVRGYLIINDKELNLQATNPKVAGIIDYYAKWFHVIEELEVFEQALPYMNEKEKETFKELANNFATTGLDLFKAAAEQWIYGNMRTLVNIEYKIPTAEIGEKVAAYLDSDKDKGIAPSYIYNFLPAFPGSDIIDSLMQFQDSNYYNSGTEDTTYKLFAEYWGGSDGFSQNLTLYRSLLEEKGYIEPKLNLRNPDGTVVQGGRNPLMGTYRDLPNKRWSKEARNINMKFKDMKIPVPRQMSLTGFKILGLETIPKIGTPRELYKAIADYGIKGYTQKYSDNRKPQRINYNSHMNHFLFKYDGDVDGFPDYLQLSTNDAKRKFYKSVHNSYWRKVKQEYLLKMKSDPSIPNLLEEWETKNVEVILNILQNNGYSVKESKQIMEKIGSEWGLNEKDLTSIHTKIGVQ